MLYSRSWLLTYFIYVMRVKLLQLRLTLCDPIDCSSPGSSVHGPWDSPARILEWVAIPFSRGPSQPRSRTCVSYPHLLHWQVGSSPLAPPGKPVLCIVACICSSQIPNLSLHPRLPPSVTVFFFPMSVSLLLFLNKFMCIFFVVIAYDI